MGGGGEGNPYNGLYWEARPERGTLGEVSSSKTQGQSVGSGEKARRKVLSTGGLFHPCLGKN